MVQQIYIVVGNNYQQNIVIMKKPYKIQGKENIYIPKENLSNPANTKAQKFGKSIRSRLSKQNNNRRESVPLAQSNIVFNRQSFEIQAQKILLDEQDKMSVSYIFTMEDISEQDSMQSSLANSRTNMSTSKKSVRFSGNNQQRNENFMSRSKSKGQSILKNSRNSDKLSTGSVTSHIGCITGGLSAKASLKDKGLDCQNKKYENALKILTYQNKKYFDDMFPPGGASLFYSKNLPQSWKDIRWVRIQDVFRGRKIILYNHEDRNTIKNGEFAELSYMATCFNALGTSPRCIQRIFENQKFSKYGLYFLRLNHEGIWKYVIIDDYIPVRQIGRNYIPVFLNVQPPKSEYVQIWPFLLQKALAKIYSTYESLLNDKVEIFMQQLTGVTGQKIQLNLETREKNELKIKNFMMNENNILVSCEPQPVFSIQFPQKYYALTENKNFTKTFFTQQTELKLLSTQKNKQNPYLLLQNFHIYFKSILVYKIDESYYSVGCIIKQQKGSISLRAFQVDAYGSCTLSVVQRDKKYFRNNGYDYSWMRIILLCKDLQGYRYLNGAYCNNKIVSINCFLNPGQYFVLVSGDWEKKVYDVTLNYQGNIQVSIRRQQLSKYPRMVDEMCSDIAQRFGNFVQLNKNICSYQCIDKRNGFIIENFNNELDKQVFLHRRYKIPFANFINIGSAKFTDEGNKNAVKKVKIYEIETFLQKDANLTMALMLNGGIDEEQLQKFSFNSC